jgi:hypothetical protein
MLHDMTCLVAEDAHAFRRAAALHVDDLLALQAHQPRMGQVKRDGDPGRIVRAEPLVRNPGVRPDADALFPQFAV